MERCMNCLEMISEKKLEKTTQEYKIICEYCFKTIENRLEVTKEIINLRQEIKDLNDEIDSLEADIDSLEEKIDTLEEKKEELERETDVQYIEE